MIKTIIVMSCFSCNMAALIFATEKHSNENTNDFKRNDIYVKVAFDI